MHYVSLTMASQWRPITPLPGAQAFVNRPGQNSLDITCLDETAALFWPGWVPWYQAGMLLIMQQQDMMLPTQRSRKAARCAQNPLSTTKGTLSLHAPACNELEGPPLACFNSAIDRVHLGQRVVPPDVPGSQQVACTQQRQ